MKPTHHRDQFFIAQHPNIDYLRDSSFFSRRQLCSSTNNALFIIAILFFQAIATAEPPFRYFVTLFASENANNQAAASHSSAEFAEVRPDGSVRIVQINWLPEEAALRGRRRLLPVLGIHRGQNPDIATTIARSQMGGPRTHKDVYAFGPYEIRAELFEKAERQAQVLDAGQKAYSLASTVIKAHRHDAPQCIQALDLLDDVRSGFAHGRAATQAILDSYARNGYVLDKVSSVETPTKVTVARNEAVQPILEPMAQPIVRPLVIQSAAPRPMGPLRRLMNR